MNRIDNYERMYLGENLKMPDAASRIDALWQAILNKEALPFEPVTRVEKYLAKIIDSSIETPNPTTRLEEILCAICRGEKVDEATKLSCKDEYLKYIYEQVSGENMFYPNHAFKGDFIKYSGRNITLNGTFEGGREVQFYDNLPISVDETVTLRYTYKSGKLSSDGSVIMAPFWKEASSSDWATSEKISLTASNYNQSRVVVTKITQIPSCFNIYINEGKNTTFDNLTFEISFEKGDTTQ